MIAPGSEVVAYRVFTCACGARRVAQGRDPHGLLGRWKALHEAACHGGRPVPGWYREVPWSVVRPPQAEDGTGVA